MTQLNRGTKSNLFEQNMSNALLVLASTPMSEIKIMLDKVHYYLEHLSMISSQSTDYKVEYSQKSKFDIRQSFLENSREILIKEIERREGSGNVI